VTVVETVCVIVIIMHVVRSQEEVVLEVEGIKLVIEFISMNRGTIGTVKIEEIDIQLIVGEVIEEEEIL
jgi:hypothetical protein